MKTIRRITQNDVSIELVGENFKYSKYKTKVIDVNSTTFLPPVDPKIIVCVHLNYKSRLDEMKRPQPPAPTYFLKPTSCLNSHKEPVIRPPQCQFLNYEGEIALVVGKKTQNISLEDAPEYIAGYTIANDFGLHDFRETDQNSMVRVKGFNTLGVLGPDLAIGWDYRNKIIRTRVDKMIVQEANTNDMIWSPEYLLSDLSRSITFNKGDVILTGTPSNSRPVSPGCVVSVEVEGLGVLENPIIEGELCINDKLGAQPMDTTAIRKIALGSDYKEEIL